MVKYGQRLKMFRDRIDAGQKLASELKAKYPNIDNAIVLALPRGGVVIGYEIAHKLNWPLDIIVTRKIGAPGNPEYAIGAVSENTVVLGKDIADKQYLEETIRKKRQEIQRRILNYCGKKPSPKLRGKNILLVDDGLATGLTMIAAIKEIRLSKPAKIIIAVPVAPPETVENLKRIVDDIIVLNIEPLFFAVGQFYENFAEVSDENVTKYLRDF